MNFKIVRLMFLKKKLRSNGVKEAEVSVVVHRIENLLKEYVGRPFKMGKTDNPKQRTYKYANEGYSILKIVFEHPCLDVIDDMEKYLIRYFEIKEATCDDITNVNDGGAGRKSESFRYYIYVTIKTNNNEHN